MVEGARLESVYTGNRIEGSNPSVSANVKITCPLQLQGHFYFGVLQRVLLTVYYRNKR